MSNTDWFVDYGDNRKLLFVQAPDGDWHFLFVAGAYIVKQVFSEDAATRQICTYFRDWLTERQTEEHYDELGAKMKLVEGTSPPTRLTALEEFVVYDTTGKIPQNIKVPAGVYPLEPIENPLGTPDRWFALAGTKLSLSYPSEQRHVFIDSFTPPPE